MGGIWLSQGIERHGKRHVIFPVATINEIEFITAVILVELTTVFARGELSRLSQVLFSATGDGKQYMAKDKSIANAPGNV
jgi:hypothetical protein